MRIENLFLALAITILISLTSCNEPTKKNDTSFDTSSVSDSISVVPSSTSSINNSWIYDTLVNRNKSIYEERTVTIEKNVRLNDSVFYVLYTVSGPVNSTKYVLPFINNKPRVDEMISESPDGDYSIPNYEFTEYQQLNDTLFNVFNYDQNVKYPEKVLDKDGHFKDGFDFENVDIKTDTLVTKVTIHKDGSVSKEKVK